MSWNSRGLVNTHKQQLLHEAIIEHQLDVTIIAHTNMSPKEETNLRHSMPETHNVISSHCPTDSQAAPTFGRGIVMIIKKNLAGHIVSKWKVPGRVICLRLKWHRQRELSIYGIYAPTAPHGIGAEETGLIAEKLRRQLQSDLVAGREIILLGDLNSYKDNRMDYLGNAEGQQPSSLIDALEDLGLQDAWRATHPTIKEFSFCNKAWPGNDTDTLDPSAPSMMFSRLDHCYSSPTILRRVHRIEYDRNFPVPSDHRPIIMTLTSNLKPIIAEHINKLHTRHAKEEDIADWSQEIERFVTKHRFTETTINNDNLLKLQSKMVKAAQRRFGRPPANPSRRRKQPRPVYTLLRSLKKRPNDTVATDLMDQAQDLFPTLARVATRGELLHAVLLHSQKLHNKNKKQAIKRFFQREWQRFGHQTGHTLQRISGVHRTHVDSIRDGETWTFDTGKIKEAALSYFSNVFDTGQETSQDNMEQFMINPESCLAHSLLRPIDIDELQSTIASMASGKAAGVSGLTTDMIKWTSMPVRLLIMGGINKWLIARKMPTWILKCQIVAIPKPNFDGTYATTRPINLIETLRKILSSTLTKRLVASIDRRFHPNAFGFRPGRQTLDAAQCVQRTISHAKQNNRQLLLLAIDIRKAFDSLQTTSIRESLNFIGVDTAFTEFVSETYAGRQYRILTPGGPTTYFHPQKGLEQGDPISPVLWNVFYEPLHRRLGTMRGYTIGTTNISFLTYADDLLLVAEHSTDLQDLLDMTNQFLTAHAMKIQPTKCFLAHRLPFEPFAFQNNQIPLVPPTEPFRYLGVELCLGGNTPAIQKVKTELADKIKELGSHNISDRIAAYSINHVLLPMLAHRLSGTVMTKAQIKSIDVTLSGFLKRVLRVPRCFPTAFLLTQDMPIRIKSFADYFVEAEVCNYMVWINSTTLPGILLRQELFPPDTCHCPLSPPFITGISQLGTWLSRLLAERSLSIVPSSKAKDHSIGRMTCQHLTPQEHSKLRNTIIRHELANSADCLSFITAPYPPDTNRNNRLLGRLHEILQPQHQQLRQIEALNTHFTDTASFLQSCRFPPLDDHIISDQTIYTDGSLDPKTHVGAAAAVVQTVGGEFLHLSARLAFSTSSTCSELLGLGLAQAAHRALPGSDTVVLDSRAAINQITAKETTVRNSMRQGSWTMRNLIQNVWEGTNLDPVWTKGHADNAGNNHADRMAKSALSSQNMLHSPSNLPFQLCPNNLPLELYPRSLIKRIHQVARNDDFQQCSSIKTLLTGKSPKQQSIWRLTCGMLLDKMGTNRQRASLRSYFAKLTSGLLATNKRNNDWGFLSTPSCLSCPSSPTAPTESIEHIFNCPTRLAMAAACVEDAVDKAAKQTRLTAGRVIDATKQALLSSYSFHLAIGVVPQAVITMWNAMGIASAGIATLGKHLIESLRAVWLHRNKNNPTSPFRNPAPRETRHQVPHNTTEKQSWPAILSAACTRTFQNIYFKQQQTQNSPNTDTPQTLIDSPMIP